VSKEETTSRSKQKKTTVAQRASAMGMMRGGIGRGQEEEQGRHEGECSM
jgi:hypothetical protein